jgi:hypothetical protein
VAIGPRRPLFYLTVLTVGFVLGGFLSALLRLTLPASPAKEFFTFTKEIYLSPITLNLVLVSLTLGPVGIQVSLLGLVGIVLAYFLARSLF